EKGEKGVNGVKQRRLARVRGRSGRRDAEMAPSLAFADKELEEQLLEAGTKLVDPPSSVEELLPLLDVITECWTLKEQHERKIVVSEMRMLKWMCAHKKRQDTK
ncbi:hypothetical protein CR513_45985, partial [Mucuna pruriens]